MTPEELHKFVDPQLLNDFESKLSMDILRVTMANEDIFFGKSLPIGLGSYLCLTSLSSVIHGILNVSVQSGFIRFEDVNEVLALMIKEIKKGIESVKLPSK